MANLLKSYLNGHATAHDNCVLFAADWVMLATGIDPAGSWRCSGERLIDAKLARTIARQMKALGFQRTRAPITGDVGLVRASVAGDGGRSLSGIVAAIRFGNLWIARHPTGLSGHDWRTVAAWRIAEGI